MVVPAGRETSSELLLSVLALSSRFDGHVQKFRIPILLFTFSTRSVESF